MKTFVFLYTASSLLAPVLAGEEPKTNSSLPVADELTSQHPYSLNGLVMTEAGRGSGFVASHPKLFFTAAHVLFDSEAGEGGDPAWSPPPQWFGGHNAEAEPSGDGIQARGYFRWIAYAEHVATTGTNSRAAFSKDVALAWGLDPFTEEEPAVIDFKGNATLQTPNASMITGYPASILYTGEAGSHFLHSTEEDFTPYKASQGRYLYATHISTGPGNSGGPVWVRGTEGEWLAGGILVSGRPSETGVYAMSSEIKSLLKTAQPLLSDPRQSVKTPAGVGASSKLGVLAKPKKIPDGRHQWTRIPLSMSGFPEGATVTHVRVNVTITTTHRGDLIVALAGPDGMMSIIHDGQGAGEDDLVIEDRDLSGSFSGGETGGEGDNLANGRWQLLVQDRLTGDLAVVTRFELEIGAD